MELRREERKLKELWLLRWKKLKRKKLRMLLRRQLLQQRNAKKKWNYSERKLKKKPENKLN